MSQPWLDFAISQLGVRETPGPTNNPVIMKWARDAKEWLGAVYTGDAVPWCGLFVARCMAAAGFKPPGRGIVGLRAKAWAEWGVPIELSRARPPIGAIGVLSRAGGGHVYLITGVLADGTLVGVGGNQSDAVTIASFPRSRHIAIRYPAGVPIGPPVPIVSRASMSTRED
jgi:uncharacterized protein (TIGR02594 family)